MLVYGGCMSVYRVRDGLYFIDVKPLGCEGFLSVYVVRGGDGYALVETGPKSSINNLLQGLSRAAIPLDEVKYVFLTHIHIDHAGGCGALIKYLPNARVVMHPRAVQYMVDTSRLWESSLRVLGSIAEMYGGVEPIPRDRIVEGIDGLTISLGGVTLRVIDAVGHASHELCFHYVEENGLFTGDAAGVYIGRLNAIRPTTPPVFHLRKAIEAIDKLISMNPSRLFYSHFGPADGAVEKLRRHREQLVKWGVTIARGLRENLSVDEIYNRIVEVDDDVKVMDQYLKGSLILEEIPRCIQGFIDYFKRYPEDFLSWLKT
jgi:glyoxylase-like metal-dependent hydrolase (beta-lactamase superfamily II)